MGRSAQLSRESSRKLDLSLGPPGRIPGCEDAAGARIHILRSLSEMDAISGEWDALAADAPPMAHFGWSRAAAECLHVTDRLNVMVLEQDGRILAIAPLVERRAPLRRLEVLGAGRLCEPVDFLYRSCAARRKLLQAVYATGAPLYIPRVFEQSGLIESARKAYSKGFVIMRPAPGCARVELDEGWREPERKLSASRRRDLKRCLRMAQSQGPVSMETLIPEADQLRGLLDEAYRIEQSNWKGRMGSSLSRDAPLGLFFRKYAARVRDQGMLRLFFLRIGGSAAAMEIAVECAGTLWGLKLGYDENFKRCAPGLLLMTLVLRDAASRGLKYRAFLGSAEPWQLAFTKDVRSCVSLHVYPPATLSLAQLVWHAAERGMRKLWKLSRIGAVKAGCVA